MFENSLFRTIVFCFLAGWLLLFPFGKEAFAQLQVSTSATHPSCPGYSDGGGTATPSGGQPPYFWVWSTGETTSSISNKPAGSYFVRVSDANSAAVFDTLVLVDPPGNLAVITPSDSTTFCEGGTINLDAENPAFFAYQWSTGATSSSIDVSVRDFYYVITTDSNGCVDTSASLLVNVIPEPQPDLGPDRGYCEGDSIPLFPGIFPSYSWSTGATDSLIHVSSPGGIAVSVTDGNGCVGQDTVFISPLPAPTVSIVGDTVLCDGNPIILAAPQGFSAYRWSHGDTNRLARISARGRYFLEVTDTNGCVGQSNYVNVFFVPSTPLPLITFNNGILETDSGATYQWFWEGLPIQGATGGSHFPQDNGSYEVLVDDGNGCPTRSDALLVFLQISDLDIPEGFSPNGDGTNDQFRIRSIEFIPQNHLTIMNRWGATVFQMEKYDNSWEGKDAGGRDLPDGTYFYVLELNNGQEPITGYILINR